MVAARDEGRHYAPAVVSRLAKRTSVQVPFLALEHTHRALKDDLLAEIAALVETNAFINGPSVKEFEHAFAAYCGTDHCVGVASGLDALRLGLIAADVRPGDEVIVPANTFVATVEAILQAGCRPVLVDVTNNDLNIDVEAVRAAIGPRTRCVMPVHLYGQMADLRSLAATLAGTEIAVFEDACQAHGASRDGISPGSGGTMGAAFSFYPGKNLGAWGDAGAFVCSDETLASKLRALREHGQTAKYHHEWQGYTARLDTIQALVLLRKLVHLDEWNDQRRRAAAFYNAELDGIGDVILPPVAEASVPVWHLYVIRTAHRDELAAYLRDRGIATALHYPQPVHLAPAYEELGGAEGSFPVSEQAARTLLSLPIFPGITDQQLNAVAAGVAAFFADA